MIKPTYQRNDAKVHKKETCYEGFFRMSKLTLQHKLFSGQWSDTFTREMFERGEATAVLLYDPKQDIIVLTEQFRVGALDEISPWQYEVVAGMIDHNQTPEQVAVRETQEECGATIEEKQLTPVCRYLSSSGGCNEVLHVFYAEIDSTHIEGVHGLDHESEDIRVCKVNAKEAFRALENGLIANAATIIALQWLELKLMKQAQP